MKTKHQIWAKLAVLSGSILILLFVMMWFAVVHGRDTAIRERQGQIRSVVESVISAAKHFHRQAELGKMTEAEAKERTKDLARSVRYGDHGYMFIYNTNGITEAHAFYRELEGKYRLNLRDAKGVPYIRNQIAKALEGGGFTYYHYKKPNRGPEVYPKMVYDKLFEPWNWVFVTGVYIDDIEQTFGQRFENWIQVLVPIIILIIGLTIFLARMITKPLVSLEDSVIKAHEATKAKSDFLANMSHEIRTPLNGAMGMLALILGTKLTPQQKEWATISYQSCEDLLNLINDILDISKVEAEQMKFEAVPFDLQATVKTVTDMMYPRARRKDIEILVAFQTDLPRFVVGDPVRLRQVLMNLVSNAVKFTEEGHIMISVEGHHDVDDVHLKFEVRDTGIGIPKDKQLYIFEKFSQGEEAMSRSHGGTGLGLAISRKLSQMMKGDVGCRSVEGEGSTFWFTAVLGYENSPPAVSSDSPHNGGEKIIIDVSHKLMRKVVTEHLNSWSYHCASANTGGGLSTMLNQEVALGQPYDFAIVEVPVDIADVRALEHHLRSIHNASPNTQMIMVVSPDVSYDYDKLDLVASVGVLTKPIFPQDLFDVINQLLEARRKGDEPAIIGARSARRKQKAIAEIVPELPTVEAEEKIILIAEDQKVNQMLMKTVLGQFGYKTDVASNGVEAVKLAAENEYDLIFMDGHMPEMDGLEATKQIRGFEARLKRHTPIVALTADAMKGDRDKCLAAGMDDYLHKPVKAHQIKEMVEKHTLEKEEKSS